MYGPFPSRLAAERYCDAVLDLFKLRRCHEDLAPLSRTSRLRLRRDEKVHRALQTSLHTRAVRRRNRSSERLLRHPRREHARRHQRRPRTGLLRDGVRKSRRPPRPMAKSKSAAGLADEIVRPIPNLHAVIVQEAAIPEEEHPEQAAIFLLKGGCLAGPERTLNTRSSGRQRADQRRQLAVRPAADAAGRSARGRASNASESPEDRARTRSRRRSKKDRPSQRSRPVERPSLALPALVLPPGEAANRRDLPAKSQMAHGRSAEFCAEPHVWFSENLSRCPTFSARPPKEARVAILHEGRPSRARRSCVLRLEDAPSKRK